MNQRHEEEYTFCPECGALMKEGICMCCGFEEGQAPPDGPEAGQGTPFSGEPQPEQPFPGEMPQGRPYAGSAGDGPPPHGPDGFRDYGPQGYGPGGSRNYGPQGGGPGGSHDYGPKPAGKDNIRTLIIVIILMLAVLICLSLAAIFFLVRNSVRTLRILEDRQEETVPLPVPEEGDGFYGRLPYEDETPEETAPEPEEDYIPDADDEYYVTLANAVRDDLSYRVEWKEYDLRDEDTGATAAGRYPQLVGGNIPQLEKLNGLIESEATYFSDLYQYYRGWQGESVVYQAESIGYVTYMDEEKLSIVLKESWQMDGQSNLSLYSINVDLLSGEVQNNGGIIEYTRQLAEEFREQSSYQNGRVEAVEMLDDERLLDFLSDENTNIVFYTPVGLEIGFNYTTSDSTGWVTATIKDYGRYVPKF